MKTIQNYNQFRAKNYINKSCPILLKKIKNQRIISNRKHILKLLGSDNFLIIKFFKDYQVVISISRSGLLKSCARFIIERSEIRKKQYDFKSVHFECRNGFLHDMDFPQNAEKNIIIIKNSPEQAYE